LISIEYGGATRPFEQVGCVQQEEHQRAQSQAENFSRSSLCQRSGRLLHRILQLRLARGILERVINGKFNLYCTYASFISVEEAKEKEILSVRQAMAAAKVSKSLKSLAAESKMAIMEAKKSEEELEVNKK